MKRTTYNYDQSEIHIELGACSKLDRATFSALSTETFNLIWNNAEDAVYDNYWYPEKPFPHFVVNE